MSHGESSASTKQSSRNPLPLFGRQAGNHEPVHCLEYMEDERAEIEYGMFELQRVYYVRPRHRAKFVRVGTLGPTGRSPGIPDLPESFHGVPTTFGASTWRGKQPEQLRGWDRPLAILGVIFVFPGKQHTVRSPEVDVVGRLRDLRGEWGAPSGSFDNLNDA
jgi:hypothetical protein